MRMWSKNTESHQMIEEFMLAANIAVAEALRDRGLQFPAPYPSIAQSRENSDASGVLDRTGL